MESSQDFGVGREVAVWPARLAVRKTTPCRTGESRDMVGSAGSSASVCLAMIFRESFSPLANSNLEPYGKRILINVAWTYPSETQYKGHSR